jgi:rubrerythrin
MNTVEEVLDFAIEKEQEAADFYLELAKQTGSKSMKGAFLEFSAEEIRHKERLLAVKAGDANLSAQQQVMDLRLSDYLVEMQPGPNMPYQDALIMVMKREQAAFRLYTDMSSQVDDPLLQEVFIGLAKEEAKHKLYFESEYDERVLADN